MSVNIVEALINSPYTPHETVQIIRKKPYNKSNGAQGTLEENLGAYTVMMMPPDTTNNADGTILEQLLAGNDVNKVFIMYGVIPLAKVGDFVKRIQTDKMVYEIKVLSQHAQSAIRTPITHDKFYIVLKDNQEREE